MVLLGFAIVEQPREERRRPGGLAYIFVAGIDFEGMESQSAKLTAY